MKLYIKQKVFSIGEKFTVKDEFGEDRFYVEGSFMRIPKNFIIRDVHGDVVSEIEKQMFRLLARYDISMPGKDAVELKRQFTFFRSRFEIIGRPWELQGDFWAHNYRVINGNQPVMSLSKHWFTWGDSYELDIPNENDAVLALSIAIAIDREIAEDNSSSSSSSN